MFMIKIRRAIEEDAMDLIEIAKSRWVSGLDTTKKTGLVDYRIPNKEKYAKRIGLGLFYVAEDTDSQNLIGFLDCYRDKDLGNVFPNDPVIQEIINSEKERFAYINTWIVRENYEGRGITYNFIKTLKSDLEKAYAHLWAAIVHKPVKNIMSIAFGKRMDFNLEKEFELPGSCTFGFYRMKR